MNIFLSEKQPLSPHHLSPHHLSPHHVSPHHMSPHCALSVLSGHEEDLQGVPEVPGLEEEAHPGPEAVDVPGAERPAVHQPVGADGAASRLSGEHRRERTERGEDAPQRRRGDLKCLTSCLLLCLFVCQTDESRTKTSAGF